MNNADKFFSQAPKYRTKKRLKALFDEQEKKVHEQFAILEKLIRKFVKEGKVVGTVISGTDVTIKGKKITGDLVVLGEKNMITENVFKDTKYLIIR